MIAVIPLFSPGYFEICHQSYSVLQSRLHKAEHELVGFDHTATGGMESSYDIGIQLGFKGEDTAA